MKGLEVEQGMDHIVDFCFSAFFSTPIFIVLSTMEYGVFKVMNTMYEIVYVEIIFYILSPAPHPQLTLFLRLECISFFFMLKYFNIIHDSPPPPNLIIPHTKSGRDV